MKKVLLLPMVLMGMTLSFSSCGDDDENVKPVDPQKPTEVVYDFKNLPADNDVKLSDEQMGKTVATFVDGVAIPTYKLMLEKMTTYNKGVEAFVKSKDQKDLDNACEAWREVRIPWEQSEAFLFGAADLAQLDPSLDSWPLDKNGIEQIIKTGDFSKIEGGVDEEAEDGPQNLRGFHTAEKMLFYNGESRKIKDLPFDENELKYLQLVSARMLKDTESLYYGWTEGLGNDVLPTAYGDAMRDHNGNSDYASLNTARQAIELMLNGNNGMAAISNEVGAAKITDPVNAWNGSNKDANDPENPGVLAVESWYSWNSIDDYKNNIVSIKNAYFGGRDKDVENADENSLHNLTKMINPTLDSLMIVQIDKTIDAIGAIGYPFRNNLGDKEHIDVAIQECASLTEGLGVISSKFTE